MEMNNDVMLHGLYGSQINRSKACAYCYLHKAHLTTRTMKQHECLKKQCDCLKKHEEHPYWAEREHIKELKKAKKTNM